METPLGGPCEAWEPLCVDFPVNPTPEQDAVIDVVLEAATEVLWNRTKRQFGLCTLTLRPCRTRCTGIPSWLLRSSWQNTSGWGWPFPALIGGQWFNLGCDFCGDDCDCGSAPSRISLPYPLRSVTEVLIDGVALDPSAYAVYNNRDLVRMDGGTWPTCNDLGSDIDEPGTWAVTATFGVDVPQLGQMAVGQLASQMYKSCTGDAGCLIPGTTIKQISRQGVTKVFFDAETAFKGGRIGLYYPDLFISTYNPTGSGMASIYDIDGGNTSRRQMTWAPGS